MCRLALSFAKSILAIPAALCVTNATLAEDHLPASEAVTIRAKGPLPKEAISTIAQVAKPTVLDRANYPDAPRFSAREVIRALCGSYRDAYWQETLKANPNLTLSLDTPLGEQTYRVKWPACAYVIQKNGGFHYTVKPGDIAADVYRRVTGSVGGKIDIDKFFKTSSVKNIAKIRPGEVLSYSSVTKDTPLLLGSAANVDVLNTDQLKILSAAATEVAGATSAPPAANAPREASEALGEQQPLPTSNERKLTIAAGRISSVATNGYLPPDECKITGNISTGADRVVNAYKYSLEKVWALGLDQYPALVAIVDNGFSGAHLSDGKLIFGAAFPARFFGTPDIFGDGEIGFTINSGTSVIYPLNSENDVPASEPAVVAGHGTHISGLILGGPSFESHIDIFDRYKDKPWLHLLVINVGAGSDTLTPNSETELFRRVRLLENRIVNLSLEYQDTSDASVQSTFEDLVTDTHSRTNLFVVASGNDASSDVGAAHYYPAALGGSKSTNVISVAAYRGDGSLANFSNRGRYVVDIAAPGCNVLSWLGETDSPAPVSGTSQAAAEVTSEAALLRSLGNPSAAGIKARIFVSGDLLSVGTYSGNVENQGELNPDPSQVMSRSRINVAKSMFLFDDYVRYRNPGDSADREAIGQITQLPDFICDGDQAAASDWRDVWAYKTDANGPNGWLYVGRLGSTINAPCHAKISSAHSMFVKVSATIDSAGNIVKAAQPTTIEVQPQAVREYLAKSLLTSP